MHTGNMHTHTQERNAKGEGVMRKHSEGTSGRVHWRLQVPFIAAGKDVEVDRETTQCRVSDAGMHPCVFTNEHLTSCEGGVDTRGYRFTRQLS